MSEGDGGSVKLSEKTSFPTRSEANIKKGVIDLIVAWAASNRNINTAELDGFAPRMVTETLL